MRTDAAILQICRFALAFVWLYQGLVPKLLGPHPDELAMGMALGFDPEAATRASYLAGVGEMLMGGLVLVFYRHAWPFVITVLAMIGLFVYTLLQTPQFLVSAFNSVTVNVAVGAIAVIALGVQRGDRW
jgi:hypothetical protein